MDFEEHAPVTLIPCHYCGRNFAKESIARHSNICIKTSKKRPVFDSSKQRDGGDNKVKKKLPSPTSNKVRAPKTNWREKHNDFMNTLRVARQVTAAKKEGKPLPPPPPPTFNPDYVQCPNCQRRFNEHAAARHIKFCEEQHKRIGIKKQEKSLTSQAAARASARQGYRAPLPSAGRRKSNSTGVDGPRSAQNMSRTSPAKFNFQNSSGYSPSASNMARDNSGRTASYSSKPRMQKKPAVNRPWNSTMEENNYTVTRTKTGLKPALTTNLHGNKTYGNNNEVEDQKSMVRKVANRGINNDHARSTNRVPRHDWSSESTNSDFSDGDGYNASKYTLYSSNSRHTDSSIQSKDRYKPSITEQHGRQRNLYPNNRGSGVNGWSPSNRPPTKFCHECGSEYPVATAKFCCECGIKRIVLS